jgi:hypothetical protein
MKNNPIKMLVAGSAMLTCSFLFALGGDQVKVSVKGTGAPGMSCFRGKCPDWQTWQTGKEISPEAAEKKNVIK